MKRWKDGEACARKKRHRSEDAAGAALGRMHMTFKARGWKERFLHVYRCNVCSTWHIGHDVKAMWQIENLARANVERQRQQNVMA